MKNSADQGGCYPQRPKAEVDNTLRDLQNSSYPTKAELNSCFIIHLKYFLLLKGVSPLRSLFFPLTKYNTTLFLGFLGQRFNNLWRAVLLTSLIQYGEDFDVIGSIIFGRLHFDVIDSIWRRFVPNLVNGSWLW